MNKTSQSFNVRCRSLLEELCLCAPGDAMTVTPLAGGVASDIALVQTRHASYCVKFALGKLKVAEVWHAPIHRNKAEYSWLLAASNVVPVSVPMLYGRSDREGGFAMEYLTGQQVYLWKQALLEQKPDQAEAAILGNVLAKIHAASTAAEFDVAPFRNRDDFHALRLEPYLIFTASRHPSLGPRLHFLAERLYQSDRVLVHGDVSPKNIMFRNGTPILLDAECATMGDASFDVAFCLNHLILKALHLPESRSRLLANVGQFWTAYSARVTWENPADLEGRICDLLPALMLARVDGKSPVEYLNSDARDVIRRVSIPLIAAPGTNLAEVVGTLKSEFEGN